ncbi:MAG TPA: hypothetical protein VIH58_09725, partial [Chthoniobacterales bacterium]
MPKISSIFCYGNRLSIQGSQDEPGPARALQGTFTNVTEWPPIGSGPAAAGSMRPNGVPNVTVVSKRRVCLGSTRS